RRRSGGDHRGHNKQNNSTYAQLPSLWTPRRRSFTEPATPQIHREYRDFWKPGTPSPVTGRPARDSTPATQIAAPTPQTRPQPPTRSDPAHTRTNGNAPGLLEKFAGGRARKARRGSGRVLKSVTIRVCVRGEDEPMKLQVDRRRRLRAGRMQAA